jgi:hypothetical protein
MCQRFSSLQIVCGAVHKFGLDNPVIHDSKVAGVAVLILHAGIFAAVDRVCARFFSFVITSPIGHSTEAFIELSYNHLQSFEIVWNNKGKFKRRHC